MTRIPHKLVAAGLSNSTKLRIERRQPSKRLYRQCCSSNNAQGVNSYIPHFISDFSDVEGVRRRWACDDDSVLFLTQFDSMGGYF